MLLVENDPEPVEDINGSSKSPIFLLSEHAGRCVPLALGDLGVSERQLDPHRFLDVGAEALARCIADILGAPLVMQRYSRLVIDCNRPPGTIESVPQIVDGVPIPGNQKGLTENRYHEIFFPLDGAIQEGLKKHKRKAAFSIHSFTPRLLHGPRRPWHCGFLSRLDMKTAEHLRNSVLNAAPELEVAVNQPYQIDDETDWFIPTYAEPQEMLHSLIEVRNDQLMTQEGIDRWAELLANAIKTLPELQQ